MPVFPVWTEGKKTLSDASHDTCKELHYIKKKQVFVDLSRLWEADCLLCTKKEEDFLDCGFSWWTSQISDPKSQSICSCLQKSLPFRSLCSALPVCSSLVLLKTNITQSINISCFFFSSFFLSGCQHISMEDGGSNFLNSVMKSVQLWDEGVTRRWNGKLKRSGNTWQDALNACEKKEGGRMPFIVLR